MTAALSSSECARLAQLESVIRAGLVSFHAAGQALREIRDSRLYREQYATWEDYCESVWNLQRMHAHRLIEAATVVSNLDTAQLPPPKCESQARALATVPEGLQSLFWQAASANGTEQPTAAHIQALVNKANASLGGLDNFARLSPQQQAEVIERDERQVREETAQRDTRDRAEKALDSALKYLARLEKCLALLGDKKGLRLLGRIREGLAEVTAA